MSEGSSRALRARLERTAVRDRDLDREIAADWLGMDREAEERPDGGKKAGKSNLGHR